MQALVHSTFGRPVDVLSVADVPRPSLSAAHVLVRVKAVGIARGDWLITNGLPYIARPSYGLRAPKRKIAGLQFAGIVEATEGQSDAFSVGDEVFGIHAESLAEFVAVPWDAIVIKPKRLSFEQAAAASTSGLAALQAIRDAAKVQPGQRVLVIGASGGVGSFAVQIAKAFAANVTGVAGTRNLEVVRNLGADHVIDYTREEPTAARGQYDVVIDIAGNRPVSRLRSALVPNGALVIVGGTGGRWTMGFERTIGAMILGLVVRQRIVGLLSTPNQKDLTELAELMSAGKVTPLVSSTHALKDAARVIEAVGTGHGAGTQVITI